MRIGEAVLETGAVAINGYEPVVVTLVKDGRPRNHRLANVADKEMRGDTYLCSGLFNWADLTEHSGRSQENVKRVLWLPFDFDLKDFIGSDVPLERIHNWPQAHIADAIAALTNEALDIFAAMGLPVHRVDYTGYGIAVYIYLPTHTADDVPMIREIHRGLVERINRIAGDTLADPQVVDAGTRIMRLPGSPNRKGPIERTAETRIYRPFDEEPVTFDQLRDAAGLTGPVADPMRRIVPKTGDPISDELVARIIATVQPWWRQGFRHAIALGLSGMLAKAGVPEDQAERIIAQLSAGDPEARDRVKAVATSYARVRAGRDVKGFFGLASVLPAAALEFLDGELAKVRQANAPRLIIGERVAVGLVTINNVQREIAFQPIPESCLIGWVGDYVRLHLPTTEAPAGFHYAVGMALAGATIGRAAGAQYAGGVLYPNLYALLVGPSGRSRKDTAIRMGMALLREPLALGTTTVLQREPRVVTDVSSPEGLLKAMDDNGGNVMLYLTELARLVSNARRKSTGSIMPLLMELYDMPPVAENLSKLNPVTVVSPVTSIVAATQPAILAELMSDADIASGFANRWFYACGTGTGALPVPPAVDWQAASRHFKRLHDAVTSYREAATGSGPFVLRLSQEAAERWDAWYRADYERVPGTPEEDTMRVRHAVLQMKLATIYAVTQHAGAIGLEHINAAIDAIGWMWRHMQELMSEWGRTIDGRIEAKMTAVLQAHGNLKKRDLFRYAHGRKWSYADMERVYRGLLSGDQIIVDGFGVVGMAGEDE